ncbi:MAG: YcjF family protein [Paracoccaceae bacterium]
MTETRKSPLVIELDDTTRHYPAEAPPVPDTLDGRAPQGQAMRAAAALAARRSSPLTRLMLWAFGAFFSFVLSLAAWDFVTGLLERNRALGLIAAVLLTAALLAALALALREWAAFSRLARIDAIRKAAETAHADGDLAAAKDVLERVRSLYAGRDDLRWGRERLAERKAEVFDADGLLGLIETELLAPLDRAAVKEVEAAARQVAAVTAFVPLALADVVAALTANLRMIRRIAEIYGGRAGSLGNWRLARTVFTHLVATGAVALGDDMIGSVAGGGLLGKLSRRFGEGVVNGALTARVGVSAIEVCRPLAFRAEKPPRVSALVSRALAGLFGGGKGDPALDDAANGSR